jgi:hypothetical protein
MLAFSGFVYGRNAAFPTIVFRCRRAEHRVLAIGTESGSETQALARRFMNFQPENRTNAGVSAISQGI